MSVYVLTPRATADIIEIWDYIRQDSEVSADRVEQVIYAACELIGKRPLVGHVKPKLTTLALRFWTLVEYSNYVVVYRPETSPVQIIAVLHGKRDISHILERRS